MNGNSKIIRIRLLFVTINFMKGPFEGLKKV